MNTNQTANLNVRVFNTDRTHAVGQFLAAHPEALKVVSSGECGHYPGPEFRAHHQERKYEKESTVRRNDRARCIKGQFSLQARARTR
jgi:hypothetical protein